MNLRAAVTVYLVQLRRFGSGSAPRFYNLVSAFHERFFTFINAGGLLFDQVLRECMVLITIAPRTSARISYGE